MRLRSSIWSQAKPTRARAAHITCSSSQFSRIGKHRVNRLTMRLWTAHSMPPPSPSQPPPPTSMTVTSTSLVGALSFIDRLSVYIPQWFYGQTIFQNSYASYGLIIGFATLLVMVIAYFSVNQPESAQDPILGKDDPLFDQSDKDRSFRVPATSPDDLNKEVVGTATISLALHFPAIRRIVAGVFFPDLLNIATIKLAHYLCLVSLVPASITTLLYVYDSVARIVGQFFKLKNNLGYFFSRYRLTLSKDEKTPLGYYPARDGKGLGMTKASYREYAKFMSRENNVKFTKTGKVSVKKQVASYVFDSKLFTVVPASAWIAYTYYSLNPALNSSYRLPQVNWLANNMASVFLAVFVSHKYKMAGFKASTIHFLSILLLGAILDSAFGSPSEPIGPDFCIPQRPSHILATSEIAHYQLRAIPQSFFMLPVRDVVTPAMFISLCLRFDYFQYYKTHSLPFHRLRSIGVPKYFTVAIIAYALSLFSVLWVSQYTGRTQTGIHYMFPALALSVAGLAWFRGEFSVLWSYSEAMIPFKKVIKQKEGEKAEKVRKPKAVKVADEINLDNFYNFDSDDSDYTYFYEDSDLEIYDDIYADQFDSEDEYALLQEIDLLKRDQAKPARRRG